MHMAASPWSLEGGSSKFHGATRFSNNVAELTVVIVALQWVTKARTRIVGNVVIGCNSEYAKCITTGEWRPKSNFQLVRNTNSETFANTGGSIRGHVTMASH